MTNRADDDANPSSPGQRLANGSPLLELIGNTARKVTTFISNAVDQQAKSIERFNANWAAPTVETNPAGRSEGRRATLNTPQFQSPDSRTGQPLSEKDFMRDKPNPLAQFSSYTYNISLYMATPEALNEFTLRSNGGLDPNLDFYLVAQSGGINIREKRAITISGELGPNKQGLDYYIDDLELKFVLTNTNGSPTVGTDIRFKIVEPTGFNFLNDLEVASARINERSTIIKQTLAKPPPLSQNYIIGVRFYGYDANGKLITGEQLENQRQMLTGQKERASPFNTAATFEKFFSFQITSVNYTIDGRVVTYTVVGHPVSKQIGHGTKFGLLKAAGTVIADTVGDALYVESNSGPNKRGLLNIANEISMNEQAPPNELIEHATEYSLEWGAGTDQLKNSKLNDISTFTAPPSSAQNSSQVNVKTDVNNQSINYARGISIPQGIPLIQIMDYLMINSEYVSNTLLTNNDASANSDPNNPTADIHWWSINPIVEIKARDSKTKDWAYKIKYVIEMQKIQYLKSLYHRRVSPFRGTHKRYDFIYTGKNTEILSFEQKYDNQFYILKAQLNGEQQINPNNTTPNHVQGGTAGANVVSGPNLANEPSKITALRINSPADQALAQIRIMGDPDYILSNVGGLNFGTSMFEQIYGMNMTTLNPYRGQIWIRIVFKGAVDYGRDGTMTTRDVEFYRMINNNSISNVSTGDKKLYEGMIYRVLSVTSNFINGKFTQTLDLVLVGENELNLPPQTARQQTPREVEQFREANFYDQPSRPQPQRPPEPVQPPPIVRTPEEPEP